MTMRIHRDDHGTSWGEILCDQCEQPQPPVADILAAGGLISLGWYCSGGRHLCPNCNPEQEKNK